MSAGPDRPRALAASRGDVPVKGRGRVVGRRDYGKYGLKDAKSGAEAFGMDPGSSPG
jgi:hypothetical protein